MLADGQLRAPAVACLRFRQASRPLPGPHGQSMMTLAGARAETSFWGSPVGPLAPNMGKQERTRKRCQVLIARGALVAWSWAGW